MVREEFEAKVKEVGGNTKNLSNENYKIIEYVYNFHPAVSETDGKRQVALLYSTFGITPFFDMLYRAKKAEEVEQRMRSARLEIEKAKEEYEVLKTGSIYHV